MHSKAQTRGFTLIEIVIVLGIFGALIATGLTLSASSYQSTIFRSERSVLVSVLQRARSRAMSNYQQSAWGVCYIAPNYVLFKGTVCIPGDSIAADQKVATASNFTSVFPVIVFSQLRGTTTPATIVLRDGVSAINTSTTTINYEGAIIW